MGKKRSGVTFVTEHYMNDVPKKMLFDLVTWIILNKKDEFFLNKIDNEISVWADTRGLAIETGHGQMPPPVSWGSVPDVSFEDIGVILSEYVRLTIAQENKLNKQAKSFKVIFNDEEFETFMKIMEL